MCPNEAVYYHERAKSYQLIEEHNLALEDFNVVIRMQKNNANAYFRRAFTYKALRKYTEASEDMFKARELDPGNPNLIINAKKMQGVRSIVVCQPGEEQI